MLRSYTAIHLTFDRNKSNPEAMWYEVLPSAALIIGFYCLGAAGIPITRYVFTGKVNYRFNQWGIELEHQARDNRLDPTGKSDGNFTNYFEVIPDLPESEKQKL